MNKEQRWGSALLSRHQSLEEEFERAKAAVEVSTPRVHGNATRPRQRHRPILLINWATFTNSSGTTI